MRKTLLCSLGLAVVALLSVASRTHAYGTWTTNGSDNCAACHGDFTANNYVSAHDGQAWSVTVGTTTHTSLHNVHRRYMLSIAGTTDDCQTCHTSASSRSPVFLKTSGGGIGFQPLSCLGCHGRPQDGGAGLRQHHFRTGTAECLDCHDDADPGSYTPVGEHTLPSYYFTPDAQHPNKPTNPCNPGGAGENAAGGPAGLDNDGDNLYDSNDPDCQVANPCAGFTPTSCAVPGQQGACAVSQTACDPNTGAVTCPQTVQPVAETCNGVDDDCDGSVDNLIPGDCNTGLPGPCANGQTACQGGAQICQQIVQPAAETCNAIDDNCDGTIDNIAPAACTVPGQVGPCANGQTACQGGTQICQQTVQPVPETPPGSAICQDTVDNDCDGAIDLADTGCQFPAETNCFDGLDDNGDGLLDCADPTCANAQGPATACGVGACAATGNRACQGGVEVDTCTPGAPTAEVCDGIDTDCDGQVDNGTTPVAITCGTGACEAAGERACVGGQLVDQCTPGQPQDEVCNNVDDDCDGTIDNLAPVPTTCGVGACTNTGELACRNGDPVDTCTPLPAGTEGPFTSPTCTDTIDNDCDGATDAADPGCAVVCVPQPEVCDGVDNDCNGEIDDGLSPTAITCGVGACQNTGERVCLSGAPADQCTPLPAGQEGPFGDPTCGDGLDNNCNTLVDGDDPNCQPLCEPTEEVCDGVDNDCNGIIDDILPVPTTCGMGACASSGERVCQNGVIVDTCAPLPPGVEQFGVADTCADNIDNDCDALVDAADPGCAAPPIEQACFDGLDNDGDGVIDCADPDCADAVDGTCDTGLAGPCAAGAVRCVSGAAACAQLVFPQPELCTDGLDNDCNGLTDAADPECAAPPVEQACFDGLDNDGDGVVDCADPDCAGAVDDTCDTGLAGTCAAGALQCVNGAAACVQLVFPHPEICTDGLDNDCDGLTDAADPDCQYVKICHVPGRTLAKVRLITVGSDAVPAHLRHGDFFPGLAGTCRE